MDNQTIVSKMNSYLHESATALVTWLEGILPRVADTWWDDCVLNSLSYTQREIANTKAFSKLSDFDLAALLRIANKSWYDMRTVAYLPSSEREVIREMMAVRNNWVHCSAELPGKDVVLHDLHTISALISHFINGILTYCRISFISRNGRRKGVSISKGRTRIKYRAYLHKNPHLLV